MSHHPAVARVLERVTGTIREHRMLEEGDRVLVAVSGGPDSLCLLHALVLLRDLLGIELGVFHLDHRLRPGSDVVAERVRVLTGELDLPFHGALAEGAPARGASVEDWAHRVRYAAFAEALAATSSRRGATGHTRDDQAESVLIGLFRGGGLSAIAGIDPVTDPYVRPLIDVTRAEVEAFVDALGLDPVRDPMNDEPGPLRNAVRGQVLPAAERATGRDLRATIARSAALLRRDARELDRQADEAAARCITGAEGELRIDAAAIASLREAIAARVVRRALYGVGATPSTADIEAVLDLAAGAPGRRRDLSGGSTASRTRGYVAVIGPSPDAGPDAGVRGDGGTRG